MAQTIGNNFKSSIRLNLFPGVELPRGYWMVEVRHTTTDDDGMTHMHSGMFAGDGKPFHFDVIIGRDVRDLWVRCCRHNSFPGNPNHILFYQIRVDRLLMLNLAHKLTGASVFIK